MPLFFFHHHGPDGTTHDDMGCAFGSLELAYLDAYRSMIDMGAELLKQQQDPTAHRLEIADASGRVLMDLHFSEVFRPRAASSTRAELEAIHEKLRRNRRLREELEGICVSARMAVAASHDLLRRTRTLA